MRTQRLALGLFLLQERARVDALFGADMFSINSGMVIVIGKHVGSDCVCWREQHSADLFSGFLSWHCLGIAFGCKCKV